MQLYNATSAEATIAAVLQYAATVTGLGAAIRAADAAAYARSAPARASHSAVQRSCSACRGRGARRAARPEPTRGTTEEPITMGVVTVTVACPTTRPRSYPTCRAHCARHAPDWRSQPYVDRSTGSPSRYSVKPPGTPLAGPGVTAIR